MPACPVRSSTTSNFPKPLIQSSKKRSFVSAAMDIPPPGNPAFTRGPIAFGDTKGTVEKNRLKSIPAHA